MLSQRSRRAWTDTAQNMSVFQRIIHANAYLPLPPRVMTIFLNYVDLGATGLCDVETLASIHYASSVSKYSRRQSKPIAIVKIFTKCLLMRLKMSKDLEHLMIHGPKMYWRMRNL